MPQLLMMVILTSLFSTSLIAVRVSGGGIGSCYGKRLVINSLVGSGGIQSTPTTYYVVPTDKKLTANGFCET